MVTRLVLSLGLSLLLSSGMVLIAYAEVTGNLTIAGNGPELTTIELLARAFEKANPRTYLDVVWDANSKPVEMVKSGQAHIAVTGAWFWTKDHGWQEVVIPRVGRRVS